MAPRELCNPDLECSILGTVLISPAHLCMARQNLATVWEHCWTDQRRQRIANLLIRMNREKRLPDARSVRETLTNSDDIKHVDQLVDSAEGIFVLDDRCKALLNLTQLRLKQVQLLTDLETINSGQVESASNFILESRQREQQYFSGGLTTYSSGDITGDILSEYFTRKQNPGLTGIPMGFPNLDRALLGLQYGTMTVVAARPSQGKTAFANQVALHAAANGFPTHIYSIEMHRKQMLRRMLCNHGRLDLTKTMAGILNIKTEARLRDAAQAINQLPISITDDPFANTLQCCAHAEYMRVKWGCPGLIILDYLQLLKIPGQKSFSRADELDEICQLWTATLKKTGHAGLFLAQLNRNSEGREPKLSDLKDSGAIEQSAHACIFLWRPGKENDKLPINQAKLLLKKNRDGSLARQDTHFTGYCQAFEPWDSNIHQELTESELNDHESMQTRDQTDVKSNPEPRTYSNEDDPK